MCLIVPEVQFQLSSFDDLPTSFLVTDAINSVVYSPYLSAVVTIDHENTIKSYSLSPSTLGRGHTLMDPAGPVWVKFSHPLLGVHLY